MSVADQRLMTVPEFSQHLGYGRTYGYQLKKEGRLVLDGNGMVLVAESIARIEATRDPLRQAVADRHAAARNPQAVVAAPAAGEGDGAMGSGNGRYDYIDAKAKREHYAAEREHALYLREAGELMDRGQVLAAFADAGAMLRSRLEGLPSVIAPLLVGRDEPAMHAVLAEQMEQALRDVCRAFERAGAGDGGQG